MTRECELKLLQTRADGLRSTIKFNQEEERKHKLAAHQSRVLLNNTLQEIDRLKERCACLEN